jgi:hypothetical protein
LVAGDLNGDNVADLVVSPDQGGGPRVRVFSGEDNFAPLADFFGIADANFRGGARVAVGDVNGDGVDDLIVASSDRLSVRAADSGITDSRYLWMSHLARRTLLNFTGALHPSYSFSFPRGLGWPRPAIAGRTSPSRGIAMRRNWWLAVALTVGVAAGYVLTGPGKAPAAGQEAKAAGRYTVVDTEATNLIVVDNQSNVLFYYTVDKDAPPGSDMHLRGSVDLNDVGKAVIKPKKAER